MSKYDEEIKRVRAKIRKLKRKLKEIEDKENAVFGEMLVKTIEEGNDPYITGWFFANIKNHVSWSVRKRKTIQARLDLMIETHIKN